MGETVKMQTSTFHTERSSHELCKSHVPSIWKIGEAYSLKTKQRHTLQRNAKQRRTCQAVTLTYKLSAGLSGQASMFLHGLILK